MTDTYYTVRATGTDLDSKVTMHFVPEFRTLAEASAFVDEKRKFSRGWIFHIDEKTREKKPTFRF